jgi:hypothetical protein
MMTEPTAVAVRGVSDPRSSTCSAVVEVSLPATLLRPVDEVTAGMDPVLVNNVLGRGRLAAAVKLALASASRAAYTAALAAYDDRNPR